MVDFHSSCVVLVAILVFMRLEILIFIFILIFIKYTDMENFVIYHVFVDNIGQLLNHVKQFS